MLDEFISALLTNTEARYLRESAGARLAQQFVYGAVEYLADYDGLSPRATRRLVESKMQKYFQLSTDEFERLKSEIAVHDQSQEGFRFLVAGARALQRWMKGRDRMTTSLTLNNLFKDRSNS